MTYRKCDFGKGLLEQLEKGYDPDRIARWAYEQSLGHDKLEDGLSEEMLPIISMEGDAQFYLEEKKLRRIAARLMES